MYRFVSYTLLFLLTMLVLSGCHTESKTYRQMAWVDTLVYQNLADSAYVELLKVKNRVQTERERAYYGLLLTKIKYMQHQPLDTDSLVSQSIAYYRKSGEDEKLADAYLAKGKNLYYRGNVKQSVTCLKESEKFVANDDNLSLKSELYRFLSMVNSRNDEFALAVKYAQKALDIAETHNNKVWKVSAYSRMAILYAKLEQEDSACFYINKCIPLLNVMSPQGAVIVMDNIGYLNQARFLYESAMKGESISGWRKADQQSFLDYCAKVESDFLLSLNATYDALTPREKIFLVLLHQGMAEEQVQRMLNLSYSSLRTLKSRIKGKQLELS